VAGSLGYCGLDRRRQPLAGDEIRPCWEAWPDGADPTLSAPPLIGPAADGRAADRRAEPLEFVEVRDRPVEDPAGASRDPAAPLVEAPPFVGGPVPPLGEPGWSLWGDPDR
jgi:hypothetical protein